MAQPGLVTLPIDAASVDGFSASLAPTAGALLPLNGERQFPFSVIPSCQPGQILKYGVSWGCSADDTTTGTGDITAVLAGAGLLGGGTSGDASLQVNFSPSGGDAGVAGNVARGDHIHDGRYYTQAQLNVPGAINSAGNPVHWTKLSGVPAGLADGVDGIEGGTAADLVCAGCVHATDIADNAVTAAKISDGQVGVNELAFDPATQAELDAYRTSVQSAGTINTPSNPVDWTKLKGVPATLADGVDHGLERPAFLRATLDAVNFSRRSRSGRTGSHSSPTTHSTSAPASASSKPCTAPRCGVPLSIRP